MKNVNEMRDQLTTLFMELKDGKMDVKVAAEMNNTAGKIINTLKVQLDYASLRKEIPTIKYLETDEAE